MTETNMTPREPVPEMTPRVGRWEAARVKMNFPDGTVDATEAYAHPAAPGLAITRDKEGYGWSVTHVASGHAVARTEDQPRLACRAEAERFALALAPLTDWTVSADAIMADKPTLARKVNAVRVSVFGASSWDAEDESDDE